MSGISSAGEAARIAVVGGGLAGMAAALACADAGAQVTLIEKRKRLGGLTWSFEHDGLTMDNGQHVFLRCCTSYLDFLGRVGSAGDVTLQDRLDVTVLRPEPGGGTPRRAALRRDHLRAPFHLARTLAGYGLVPWAQRARLGLAALALRGLDLTDPALDQTTFGAWLGRHHQGPDAVRDLWELICLPTVNLRADEASLSMAAKVFQTGLLTDSAAGDIGWSRVPLGLLHGQRGWRALDKAGARVITGDGVSAVEPHRAVAGEAGPWTVVTGSGGRVEADAVVVALPHYNVEDVLPPGALPAGVRPSHLESSPIVNVHVHYDRPVTALAMAAGLGTSAQWVFDRTVSSGARSGQYLAVSISGADEQVGARPQDLGRQVVDELAALFPAARRAQVLGTFVTKEHHATFRAVPGSAAHRAAPRSGLRGLCLAGAWTATGWPPTMEGAVRSGVMAARAALVACGRRELLPPLPREAA